MMVCYTFSQKLLHCQLTKVISLSIVQCNKKLFCLHSSAMLYGAKEKEGILSHCNYKDMLFGSTINYNLVHHKYRIGEYKMQSALLRTSSSNHGKRELDFSRVPVLKEEELEEAFVRGSGPGGQAVNKTNNCVVLTHKPTGIIVKCHESRLQDKNRKIAREMLTTKLDNYLNGDLSIEAQKKALQRKKSLERANRRKKLTALKEKWRQKEGFLEKDS